MNADDSLIVAPFPIDTTLGLIQAKKIASFPTWTPKISILSMTLLLTRLGMSTTNNAGMETEEGSYPREIQVQLFYILEQEKSRCCF